jgi:SAM-dependent methyltransferase
MNQKEFHVINDLEKRHWWYIGMKEIWVKILPEVTKKNKFKNILDLGCGTGGNLTELENFGEAEGMEYDNFALDLCNKNKHKCFQGSILDFSKIKKKYQLISIFDVLYQFEKKEVSEILNNINTFLEKDGFLMIREPAFNLAFGRHDIEVGTKTRFEKDDFIKILEVSGYKISFITYLNFFLFVPIVLRRKLELFQETSPKSDLTLPSMFLNKILLNVLRLEKEILLFSIKNPIPFSRFLFPFGVSIFLIAQKKI